MKPLWEYTRDLHHACEEHPVGAAMATGKPPMEWYAAWVKALLQIHSHIDPHAAPSIHRTERLIKDCESTGNAAEIAAANDYVMTLDNDKAISGALYVLTGAHLMGGEIMRRRLEGYPTAHLEWDDRKASLAELQLYRTRGELGEEARACFAALLRVMDEIQETYPQGEANES
jgi:heme oxygenase